MPWRGGNSCCWSQTLQIHGEPKKSSSWLSGHHGHTDAPRSSSRACTGSLAEVPNSPTLNGTVSLETLQREGPALLCLPGSSWAGSGVRTGDLFTEGSGQPGASPLQNPVPVQAALQQARASLELHTSTPGVAAVGPSSPSRSWPWNPPAHHVLSTCGSSGAIIFPEELIRNSSDSELTHKHKP